MKMTYFASFGNFFTGFSGKSLYPGCVLFVRILVLVSWAFFPPSASLCLKRLVFIVFFVVYFGWLFW